MEERRTVILDAGHGGMEPGAVYMGRQEKDDTLNLTLAVGQILEDYGVNVVYTRVTDIYHSPIEKAEIANRSGADYLVSIHRNAAVIPGMGSGAMTLVYSDSGAAGMLAHNIQQQLTAVGFIDLGVVERPGIYILRRTRIPAVLVEAGFIDNEEDNLFFDENFYQIAQAIADGIIITFREEEGAQQLYYILQVGAFQELSTAEELQDLLTNQGFPAWIKFEDGLYKVRVGAFLNLDNAARMEQLLRDYGYTTYMVSEAG